MRQNCVYPNLGDDKEINTSMPNETKLVIVVRTTSMLKSQICKKKSHRTFNHTKKSMK